MISPDHLDLFTPSLSKDERRSRLGDLMPLYTTADAIQEIVRKLFEIAATNQEIREGRVELDRHDWLVLAVNQSHPTWAHALLDQGADPNFLVEEINGLPRGGGQALREALDRPNQDRGLVERLWEMTDMAKMMKVLTVRILAKTGFLDDRYYSCAEKVAFRVRHRDDLADDLAKLYAVAGPSGMPLHAAFLNASVRYNEAIAADLPVSGQRRARP